MKEEEKEISEDWKWVIDRVASELYSQKFLKDIKVNFIEDTKYNKASMRVAEIEIDVPEKYPELYELTLNVWEDYFAFKEEVALGALLHELAHADILMGLMDEAIDKKKDPESLLKKYMSDNKGHNKKWWELVHRLEKHFKNVEVKDVLDLSDDSLYDSTIELNEASEL